jgi:hypothetical protein
MQEIIEFVYSNIVYSIGIISAFIGFITPIMIYLVKVYLNSLSMKKKTISYVNDYFYKIGLKIKKKSIDKIMNNDSKFKLIRHLDRLSDIANKAFDAGISGKERPKINE